MFEATKGAGMYDPIAIALKRRPMRAFWLCVQATTGRGRIGSKGSEDHDALAPRGPKTYLRSHLYSSHGEEQWT